MKKNLEIIEWEPKRGKNGEYVRFKTNDGWMSCFDEKVIENLKELEGNTVCVEIEEKQGKNFKGEVTTFKNIIGYHGDEEDIEEKVEVIKMNKSSTSNSDTSYYTSYVKDLLVAMIAKADSSAVNIDSLNAMAIKCVKDAKEAFS